MSIKAGVAYAVTVFAIGFLVGAARVLLLAPRVGSTIAVSVETPIILAASWYVSGRWMKRLAVPAGIRTRILVGAVAFVLPTIVEVALSVTLFHRSIGEYPAGLRSRAGAIGFAAQACFATFPLVFIHARLVLRGHGGSEVQNLNPSTDSSRLSDSTTAALAKETHTSPEVVRDLYQQEVATVGAAAKVRSFIGIIAARRLKQRLMAALKRSSDN